MTQHGKTPKPVFIAVILVLAIAAFTLLTVDYVTGSTSVLLDLIPQILIILMLVAGINRKPLRYIFFLPIIIWLIYLVLFLMDHPGRQWP